MCEQSPRLAGCLKLGAVSSPGVLYPGRDSSASWRHPQSSEGGWQCPRPRVAGRWPYPALPAALLCTGLGLSTALHFFRSLP